MDLGVLTRPGGVEEVSVRAGELTGTGVDEGDEGIEADEK
jgi:hypothetical protein